jgi:hypothetical protein
VTRLTPKKTPMRRPLFLRGDFRVICQQHADEDRCWRADANVHKIVLVKKRARLGVFLPNVKKFHAGGFVSITTSENPPCIQIFAKQKFWKQPLCEANRGD